MYPYQTSRLDTCAMFPVLLVALLVIPVAELWVIVQVADGIGVLNTLALLLLISATGAWLLKQQGMAAWRRLQASLGRGQMPADEATDGALILFGGALLMTPGFLTDAAGLLLLLPPTRAAVKKGAGGLLGRWAARRLGVGPRRRRSRIEVVDVERREGGPGSKRPRSSELAPGDRDEPGGFQDRE